jgi:hypothetical protein
VDRPDARADDDRRCGGAPVHDPVAATTGSPSSSGTEEPEEWQAPRPTLHVMDGIAYVTEPSTDTLDAVDVRTGDVWDSVRLPVTPNELTGVSGDAPAAGAHDHHHDHDADAADHDDAAGD